MGFPYHFIDLDDEQLQRRRNLLDNYGQFAQLSILSLPLLYQLSRGIKLLGSRLSRRRDYQPLKEQRSPVPFNRQHERATVSIWSWRRLKWWLDTELAPGWETRKEWLFAILWMAWLLFLVTKDTGDDYLHITKRFGIVAASQLPLHYLLATKSWSPIQYLTRMSHEELNPYHRLLGRIIILLFACHASFYLNFYIQKGLLLKRIQDWDVILGLTAITSSALLFTTALARIRDWSYRLFFYLHVALASLLLPVLYFHVTHLRLYVIESALVFIGLVIQRNIFQSTVQATISRIEHTNLLSVSIPLPPSWRHKLFVPGQHIYIGFASLPEKLRKNPFTIASPPPTKQSRSQPHSNSIELVIRTLKGSTAILDALASPQKQPSNTTELTIEGPYGSTTYFPPLDSFDRILFVAGGVGATFTLPMYLHSLGGEERESRGGPDMKFVWAVRRAEDAKWAMPSLKEGRGDARIFMTGSESEGAEGIELQEQELDVDDEGKGLLEKGRPDLRNIVDGTFEHDPHEKVAVFVCGPRGMGANLRREVGRWVKGGRDVFWHSEEFGW
ncbi:uncharacterized protein KY384_000949 [Bacidia gigantensis]|uniref:uncharacterized protein n=1 Tax=Bacidia gigantensis TaxID=2732470 RepID=UPI001D04C1B0|nr:uncharacterized protein KY384_000949 [Bacidia gigantensis]KAG8534105.1 hypothetical protein KY384_000949 [Bacidia gigantensis]